MRRLAATLVASAMVGAVLLADRADGAHPVPAPSSQWNLEHTCTFCHDPHGGPEDHNLWDKDVEVLCQTCHGPGGISSLKADRHKGHTCVDCHDVHRNVDNWQGGTNLKMVGPRDPVSGLARIVSNGELRDVVFESLGTQAGEPSLHSFSDADEDGNGVYDGACEVCHTNDVTQLPGKNHNFGQTCTVCHLHGEGFAPP